MRVQVILYVAKVGSEGLKDIFKGLNKLLLLGSRQGTAHVGNLYREFEDQLLDLMRSSDVETVVHGPDESGYDIFVSHDANAVPIVIEAKVWGTLRNVGNRVREAMSTAASVRRRFPYEVQLVLVVVTEPLTLVEARAEVFWERIRGLLLAGNSKDGYDRVLIGIAGEVLRWHSVRDQKTAVISSLENLRSEILGSEQIQAESQYGVAAPARKFLLIADEWVSNRGGISTFNRELAIALAAEDCQVHVVVPEASPGERDHAADNGVTLVTPDPFMGLSGTQLLLTRPRIDEGQGNTYKPDVIVGHGRVLGPYAHAVRELYFPTAKRLHFVHMDAESLESAKEVPGGPSRMETADSKQTLERQLSLSAHLVAGVGPLLSDYVDSQTRSSVPERPEILNFVPGMRAWRHPADPSNLPPRLEVLFIGRAEDANSKGIDIAIASVARARKLLEEEWKGETPQLIIRGARSAMADEVRKMLDEASLTSSVILRPYSSDEEDLRRDLLGASVVIMPSRHEGFGLAAYEAIAAGVPILISERSGLAKLLVENIDDGSRSRPSGIVPVDGRPAVEIHELWGAALARVLRDKPGAFEKAKILRETLANKFTWPEAVHLLLGKIESASFEPNSK